MQTRRQSLMEMLREGPATVKDLSRRLRVHVKVVLEDLEHVRRSLSGGERLELTPAECLGCGYVFADRKKIETPSRCPRCKKENVSPPEVFIVFPGS